MDADRFESLMRSLSTSPSRRETLRLLVGGAVGSLLTLDILPSQAKKGKGKKKKKSAPSTGCTSNSACTTAHPCRAGRCALGDPASDANGCVFDPVTGRSATCGVGACQRTVNPRCRDGVEQTCQPGTPVCGFNACGDDDCGGSCGGCSGTDHCSDRLCCPQNKEKSCYVDFSTQAETCDCCLPSQHLSCEPDPAFPGSTFCRCCDSGLDICNGECCPQGGAFPTCFMCFDGPDGFECGCFG
jgi:hypothetical protein